MGAGKGTLTWGACPLSRCGRGRITATTSCVPLLIAASLCSQQMETRGALSAECVLSGRASNVVCFVLRRGFFAPARRGDLCSVVGIADAASVCQRETVPGERIRNFSSLLPVLNQLVNSWLVGRVV